MAISKQAIAKKRENANQLCDSLYQLVRTRGIDDPLTKDTVDCIHGELRWWETQANKAVKEEKLDLFEEIFAITDLLNEALRRLESNKQASPRGISVGDETKRLIAAMEQANPNPSLFHVHSEEESKASIAQSHRQNKSRKSKKKRPPSSSSSVIEGSSSSSSSSAPAERVHRSKSKKSSEQPSRSPKITSPVTMTANATPTATNLPLSSNQFAEPAAENAPPPAPLPIYISSLEGIMNESLDGRIYLSAAIAYDTPMNLDLTQAVTTHIALADKQTKRASWNEILNINYPPGPSSYHQFLCFNVYCPISSAMAPMLLGSASIPLFPPEHNKLSVVEHPKRVKLEINEVACTNAFGPSTSKGKPETVYLYFQLPDAFYKQPKIQQSPQAQMPYQPQQVRGPVVNGIHSVFQSPTHSQYLNQKRLSPLEAHNQMSPQRISISNTPFVNGSNASHRTNAFDQFQNMGQIQQFPAPALPHGVDIPSTMEDTPTVRLLLTMNETLSDDLSSYKQKYEDAQTEIDQLKRELHIKSNQLSVFTSQENELNGLRIKYNEVKEANDKLEERVEHVTVENNMLIRENRKLFNDVNQSRSTIHRHEMSLQASRLDLIKEKKKIAAVMNNLENHEQTPSPNLNKEADKVTESKPVVKSVSSAWIPRVRPREHHQQVTPTINRVPTNSLAYGADTTDLLSRLDKIDDWGMSSASTIATRFEEVETPTSAAVPKPVSVHTPTMKILPVLSNLHNDYAANLMHETSFLQRTGILMKNDDIVVVTREPENADAASDYVEVCFAKDTSDVEISLNSKSVAGASLTLTEMPKIPNFFPPAREQYPNQIVYKIAYESNAPRIFVPSGLATLDLRYVDSEGQMKCHQIILPITPFMMASAPVLTDDFVYGNWNDISQTTDDLMNTILMELLSLRGTSSPSYPQSLSTCKNVKPGSLFYRTGLYYSLCAQFSCNDSIFKNRESGLSSACKFATNRALARSMTSFYKRGSVNQEWRVVMIGCDSNLPPADRKLQSRIQSAIGDVFVIELYEIPTTTEVGITFVASTSDILSEMNDSFHRFLNVRGDSVSTAEIQTGLHKCGRVGIAYKEETKDTRQLDR